MSVDPLKTLSDLVNDAHTQIQAAHQHINPVVEVRQSMRDVGIPADVLPYIFNPFFTTKKRGEGSGLGLSICRELIEQFGGKISVETREGEGTTFSIKLLEADLDSAEPKTP